MKPLRITVEPSATHPDVLNIRDAMQHVLDFFEILTDHDNVNVVWNLTAASINSPFVVEGAPVDLRTKAAAFSAVEAHVRIIERTFNGFVTGDPLDHDFPNEKIKCAERLLERNTNGIGRTEYDFGNDAPVVAIEPRIAQRSLTVIRREPDILHDYLFGTFARREVGSIQGNIIEIGTHYDKPAVHVREHSTDRGIWCQVDEQALGEVERMITAGDVWQHRRVTVRGELSYDSCGQLVRIYGGRVNYIDEKKVALEELFDSEFTEGLPAHEYLERLRENELE